MKPVLIKRIKASSHLSVLQVSLTMFVVLQLCVLVAVCSLSVSASQSSSYGERGSDLGLQVFLRVVQDKPQENVVLSPHGVASILGMLLPGAHGDTRRQLLTGLKYKKTGVCLLWFHVQYLCIKRLKK